MKRWLAIAVLVCAAACTSCSIHDDRQIFTTVEVRIAPPEGASGVATLKGDCSLINRNTHEVTTFGVNGTSAQVKLLKGVYLCKAFAASMRSESGGHSVAVSVNETNNKEYILVNDNETIDLTLLVL